MVKQNIFISYCHANKNIVHKVANRLKQVHNVWIDTDHLKAGVDQDQEISVGIKNATLFLPFISDEYCNSKACKAELTVANDNEKIILPIMLVRYASNGVDIKIAGLGFFLACRSSEVFDPWSEDLFQKLLNNIKDLIQPNQAASTHNPTKKIDSKGNLKVI